MLVKTEPLIISIIDESRHYKFGANMIRTINSVGQKLVNYWTKWLSGILPYEAMKGGKELLENEYSAGTWDYLRGINELPRLFVVAGYCHHFNEVGSILEIGCGEGVLQEQLNPYQYSRYVGVDISTEVIKRTSHKQNEKNSFVVADANNFEPSECFDVIVFNECLEYFEEPLKLVKRYEPFLKKNGVFIVSMYVGVDSIRTKRIWKMIETEYIPEETTKVSTRQNYSWIIKVFIPSKNK
jgi:SAM-dependent methyltransferase